MKKVIYKTEQCIICECTSNSIISTKIREMNRDVLQCNNCGFVFLSNYEELDYSNNYKSLTFSEGMNPEEQIVMRSDTLYRFNKIVGDLCLAVNKNVKILEIGAGRGASIYGLKKIIPNLNIECVEINGNYRDYINKEFAVFTYKSIDDIKNKYDVIFGHHVFEHFVSPLEMLNKIDTISTADSWIYFSFPNFNDFYNATLNNKERKKYLEFNFHIAHPYYYTKETLTKLVNKSSWEIESLNTIQDYSIVNYFNWYINGKRSKNIADGTIVDDKISGLNNSFIELVEKIGFGNNISVVLKKR